MPCITLSTLVSALALLSRVTASPLQARNSLEVRNNGGSGNGNSNQGGRENDPEFSISTLQLDSALACIGGIENVKNPFLLVPGTWANQSTAYYPGYRQYLGKDEGLGYDVCFVSPPPYMTADIQDTMQYVVNAVHRIYDVSGVATPILGHSQGGMVIQALLTYYPSMRKEISQAFSLSGSIRGSAGAGAAAVPGETKLDPSLWMQGATSNWITTLTKKGGSYAYIPTTAIFTEEDKSVRPNNGNSYELSNSYIAGKLAGSINVQDSCPNGTYPLSPTDTAHNDMLVSNFAFQVVKLALASDKKFVRTDEVQKAVADGVIDCSVLFAPGTDEVAYNASIPIVRGISSGRTGRVIAQVVAEPLLRHYVKNASDNKVHDN